MSLRTKDTGKGMEAGAQAHRLFEALVAQALDDRRKRDRLSVELTRKVTDTDLSDIADRYCRQTAHPFERAHVLADMSAENASYLERMYHDLELDADALREAVRSHSGNDDAIISTPFDAAKAIVAEQHFDAPPGTPEFAHIVGAVRSGYERGYRTIGQLQSGEILLLWLSNPSPFQRRPASRSVKRLTGINRI